MQVGQKCLVLLWQQCKVKTFNISCGKGKISDTKYKTNLSNTLLYAYFEFN